jgi:hypothetical protein
MKADWYHIEDDEPLGPTTLQDVAGRIRHAGQSRLVWTAGIAEWTDARAVLALAQLFRIATPRSSAAVLDHANVAEPLTSKTTLSQRLRKELTEYLVIAAYLYVCFGALIFYKATVLQSDGIAFTAFGIAIVKALVLGKFILVLHALKIGEQKGGAGVLLADILKKSIPIRHFSHCSDPHRGNHCRLFSRACQPRGFERDGGRHAATGFCC